ncbi:MAG: Acetyl-coenzyme A carboxylase carboxyl transferase subunit beta [Chlamydiia bacterium]|nr:Acetyl-coenzyme A carboxylase carboxyl transferase subunit beta [Chlamydiia bacterium]MCH9614995.1 Acetyl-coenzyme A carboxylase carboxyl transferase subunit beta [Chlamydiia bacterium]MCH9629955.1 Acetyl-coenzyme A carboxylase carboxyl transferase subunit beta [Chlamydiia bacterium]
MGFLRLFSRHAPKIKISSSKKDGFSGWVKCSGCEEMTHASELKKNFQCCPKCDFHYRMGVDERIEMLVDEGSFEELYAELESKDPLRFKDEEVYQDRLKRSKKKTGRKDAIVVGMAKLNGRDVALGVLNFAFMGGSMGTVVGEKITRIIELAIERAMPVILVSASGGARMQESSLSLMQMAKTSAALNRLGKARLPYISVLTNPTTGGVTASFASLGDIIIGEPGALIGFAGPRVVEQTIKQKLPKTAQRSEFLIEKGMIDAIVKRSEMKDTLSTFLDFLTTSPEKLDVLIKQFTTSRKKNAIDVAANPGK